VWCKLDKSVVNHAIDEWSVVLCCEVVNHVCVVNHAIDEWSIDELQRRHRWTLKADILNITYDCYSQNSNVKMATLQIR